jgi:hypothetical protein
MRTEADREKIARFMSELGRETIGPGRIFLTGGATAVLMGWRPMTVDVDIKADPEPGRLFESLAVLKERLDLNVELAAPDDFIPPLPGWRDRSRLIGTFGQLQFYHYDFYAQALAKMERAHDRDVRDVRHMIECGLVDPSEVRRLFQAVRKDLIRYPAVDEDSFAGRVDEILGGGDANA